MKTPEQMAEEYLRYESESHYWARHAFLAGYKAAQEHNADASKMVWISVKDRLPEPHEKVTTCWSGKDIYWMPLPEPPKEDK